MDLGEAIFARMAGGLSDEPGSFHDALDYLASGGDSVSAMARDLGVPRSTLRGWLNGRTPRSGADRVVDRAQREWRRDALPAGRERQMRADWSTDSFTVVASYQYPGGRAEPERTIKLGEYLNDVGEDLADAFLAGAGAAELGEIVAEAINDHGFYSDTFNDNRWDVSEVDWI